MPESVGSGVAVGTAVGWPGSGVAVGITGVGVGVGLEITLTTSPRR